MTHDSHRARSLTQVKRKNPLDECRYPSPRELSQGLAPHPWPWSQETEVQLAWPVPFPLCLSVPISKITEGMTRKGMQETRVRSLGREDPLEEGMATPSRILAWRIQDRGAWRAAAPGIPKSQTQLSDLARQWDVFLSLCPRVSVCSPQSSVTASPAGSGASFSPSSQPYFPSGKVSRLDVYVSCSVMSSSL